MIMGNYHKKNPAILNYKFIIAGSTVIVYENLGNSKV